MIAHSWKRSCESRVNETVYDCRWVFQTKLADKTQLYRFEENAGGLSHQMNPTQPYTHHAQTLR